MLSSFPATRFATPRDAGPAPSPRRLAIVTLGLALLFLAWEAAGGDAWLAGFAGTAAGFPLRDHWLLEGVLHGGGRIVAWVLALGLLAGIWWPMGPLRRIRRAQRVQLAVGVLLSVTLISLLKATNPAACPWSLTPYGGSVAPMSHWAWWVQPPGGRGNCFPGGHASAGFAFIGGWFVFRAVAPGLAWRWLLAAVAAGLVLGVSQQWRGAHFMSHTLWTGWLCWCMAWALDAMRQRHERRARGGDAGRGAAGRRGGSGRAVLGGARGGADGHGGPGPLRLVLAVSAAIASLGNWPLWQALADLGLLHTAKGLGLAVALGVAVFGALVALLSLLAWRFTLKPAAIFLLLAAAAGAHFMLAYRIVIDQTMLVNVLQTDPREAGDLLSLRMVATLVLGGLLPAWLVWRTPVVLGRFAPRLARNLGAALLGLALVVAAVLASFQPLSSTMRNHKQLRYLVNPLNSVYALGMIATEPLRRNDRVLLPLGEDARLGTSHAAASRPPLLLLVVGETARAANFSLNGYARPTNPELAKLPVISWRNAWSCGTNTAASVPCMFSHLDREAFVGRKANHENLLDVAQRAGLAVLWIDNQSGCKGVCARVPSVETTALKHPALCPAGECFDPIMLDGLDARIAALPAERRAKGVLLVMHQMGSHGPAYHKRVPAAAKRFLPECSTNNLQDCNRDQLVNAYDNTIAYTDRFLAQAIGWLQQRQAVNDTALLYVSDHGESLGENNLYLHGLPYAIAPDVQKRVPWITWLSPGFAQRQRLDVACLRGRADVEVSHDHYFHSVLGLLDVQTGAYRRDRDAYAGCRGG